AGTLTWMSVACGDGGYTAVDFTTPANVYAACASGNRPIINKSTTGGGVDSFTGADGTCPDPPICTGGIDYSDRMLFLPSLVMSPLNSQTLYFGTYRLYRTTNGAATWFPISVNLTIGGNQGAGSLTAIAPAPSDANTIYVGSDTSQVNVTRNANAFTPTWTN